MKIMKWRGYSVENDLLQDIQQLRALFPFNERVQALLLDLEKYREKLCIFHVSKFVTMMRVASSIAESTHSAIKGGGEFKKLLRASNFYETMLHILQLMRIYVDDTVADLKTFHAKGWRYSPYARKFIDEAWANMARCSTIRRVSEMEWSVLEIVPAFHGGSSESASYTLPDYTQEHVVRFHSNQTHPTCTCPEYTQGLRLCAAVCAVLFSLGRGPEHKTVEILHPLWDLRTHPFFSLAMETGVSSFGGTAAIQQSQQSLCPTPLSVAPNEVLRLATLQSLIHEVILPSLKSPHFENLYQALLQQKQLLLGQNVDHEPAFAPTSAVSSVHINRAVVPEASVENMSRLGPYNRASTKRILTARSRDPTAFALHKRGVEGARIRCDCGGFLLNNKKARYYHCHNNTGHLEWLANGASPVAPNEDADVGDDAGQVVVLQEENGAEAIAQLPSSAADVGDVVVDSLCMSQQHVSEITDSVRAEVVLEAPWDPRLPVSANATNVASAAMHILEARRAREGKASFGVVFEYTQCGVGHGVAGDLQTVAWTRMPHRVGWLSRGDAWLQVVTRPADLLPFMSAEGMTHFRINQFCELCTEWQLCQEHNAMKSNDRVDLTHLHLLAAEAAGYCFVECGANGDCFYHSMMFLARLHCQQLYQKWGNHEKFRQSTCAHLLVCFMLSFLI